VKLDFYGIVDHPLERRVLWSLEDLKRVVGDPRLALSTIVVRKSPEVIDAFLSSWYSIGDGKFIGEAILFSEAVLRNSLRRVDRALLKLLTRARLQLVDVIMFNKFLKLSTGSALPDYGIVIAYANPIRPGDELVNLPRVIARIDVELEGAGQRAKIALMLNAGRRVVVDWSNMGILPYSPYPSYSNGLADPVLVLFRAGYMVSTLSNFGDLVLVGGAKDCEVDCGRPPLILPHGLKEAKGACSYSLVDKLVEHCRAPL